MIKVVLVGDTQVGKSCIISRLMSGTFTANSPATIGAAFQTHVINTSHGAITMQIWDTAGQEVYRSLVGFYTREAKGAFLVFDVTSEQTFSSLTEWVKFANEATPGVKIILFANKCDLEEARTVQTAQIKQFAQTNNIDFIEGSAKTGQNTVDAFERMGEMMLSTEAAIQPKLDIIDDGDKKDKKKNCC